MTALFTTNTKLNPTLPHSHNTSCTKHCNYSTQLHTTPHYSTIPLLYVTTLAHNPTQRHYTNTLLDLTKRYFCSTTTRQYLTVEYTTSTISHSAWHHFSITSLHKTLQLSTKTKLGITRPLHQKNTPQCHNSTIQQYNLPHNTATLPDLT